MEYSPQHSWISKIRTLSDLFVPFANGSDMEADRGRVGTIFSAFSGVWGVAEKEGMAWHLVFKSLNVSPQPLLLKC